MLLKIKAWATYAVALVFAALLVIINVLRAKSARLDAELQRRELQRERANTAELQRRSEKGAKASAQSAKARLQAEEGMRDGRRNYFEKQ
ncbi:MAG: hypothetical protein Q4A74_01570 [Cardiobacteriaceae bacterium]|nr:hypothetical protein [Cardiobacteriaceae bacterium]